MKKKVLFIVSAIVLAISVSAFVYVKNENNSIKQLFDANVEALAEAEITVGRICVYDVNMWCIYLFPYEEYQGQFID